MVAHRVEGAALHGRSPKRAASAARSRSDNTISNGSVGAIAEVTTELVSQILSFRCCVRLLSFSGPSRRRWETLPSRTIIVSHICLR